MEPAAAAAPSTPPRDQQHHPAEIWATRVQRELLALTADDGAAASILLPPFVTILEHALDLAAGTCAVRFRVQAAPRQGAADVVVVRTAVVQLDASLPPGAADAAAAVAPPLLGYPFVAPVPTLLQGQEFFAEGSTIRDGDAIPIDIEWTPSLHLTDAIVNVSLKIKESFLQGEPFHPAPPPEPLDAAAGPDPLLDLEQSARRLASSAGKVASGLARAVTALGSPGAASPPPRRRGPRPRRLPGAAPEVRIGQDINLLEEPWVDAHGVYACKAIRRPDFVEDAIAHAAAKAEEQQGGGGGYSSPSAMFKSMTKKAGSVLQESFLMITETHVIEMRSSKLSPTTATVTFCIAIDLMHKLKFRRGESLSLFFKPAPEDPLIYMCPDAGDAVHQIQSVLRRHGVKGKHTNAAAHRAIQEALQLVQEIQTKELALRHDPSADRVNEIMDLYRRAAERFEIAGDVRHEEVVIHMQKFLALPLTVSILDGTFKKPHTKPKDKSAIPQGEILTSILVEDDDDAPSSSDAAFEDNINNIMKEAKADLQRIKGSDSLEIEAASEGSDADTALAGMAADLEDMMKAADAELQELLRS